MRSYAFQFIQNCGGVPTYTTNEDDDDEVVEYKDNSPPGVPPQKNPFF